MAENFICVTQQILLLAAIILVGFALSKANLISAEGENAISALALYVATPAVVISALQRPFEAILWTGLKQTALIVILTFAVMVTVTKLTIRHADIGYRSVMRFAAIFANVGFTFTFIFKFGPVAFKSIAQILISRFQYWNRTSQALINRLHNQNGF